MAFVDSHAHLGDERFGVDRAAVLERARQAGVKLILAVAEATQQGDCDTVFRLAEEHSSIWIAAGVHPHETRHATAGLFDRVEQLMRSPRVLAWGEIGLDYHYNHSPRETQQRTFREQLQRARLARKPVVIHCREAWDDCLVILAEEWTTAGLGGIFHCFSGSKEVALRGLDWGFLISFAGNVTFLRAEGVRAAAQALPLDSLLVETDAPYLAPQVVRGRRNEPAYVVEVAAELGRLHGLTREEMGSRARQNFLRLFPGAQP